MSEVPQWAVRGDWFDVCSCDIPCPCEFAQPPTRNHCQGVLAYHVREGHYGDVSLDGLNLVACGEFEGNAWAGAQVTMALFMDERADQSQREALGAIFGGHAGGWPAVFAAMVVEVRGPEFAPVHVEVADDLSSWRAEVPGRVRAVGEALSGPTTPPGARVQLLNPPGSEVGPGQIATWGGGHRRPGGRSGLLLHLGVGRPFEQAHPVRLEWAGRVSPGKGPGQGSLSGAKQGDPLASLSRQIIVAVTAWLLGCAAVAWVLVARQADTMSGMVSGLAQVGTRMPMTVAAPAFLAMWVGMMVAMMFPTAVPLVAAHHVVVRRRGEGIMPTVAFVAGYLLAWSAAGLLPLAALLVFRRLSGAAGDSRWLPFLAGLTLTIAGLYQFSRWKTICLRTCRSPFAFLMEHDFGGGTRAAVRAGLVHGAYCLGCCWALMSVLLVVGLMNLVWMLALTLVFLAEKCWRRGWVLPRVVGTALVAVGVAVAIHPPLLQLISGVTDGGATGM